MAEVSNELMLEVLKAVQARLEQVDGKIDEGRQETQALKTQMQGMRQEMLGIHQELSGIHATLVRHEHRLDRIGERLELNDVPSL
jgi:septal ring factor EnvC (AmiA/AmiB activator)